MILQGKKMMSGEQSRNKNFTLPVAEILPCIPPWLIGLPVTHACEFILPNPSVMAYVSAIQAISFSPVPMSGAGTSTPGPLKQNCIYHE